ncbi:MAG: hypothetical protein JST00_43115 [Deltaproteobacteria bacterium]|nr:hypothetical protein [Deltaproteobacteria bacterium]
MKRHTLGLLVAVGICSAPARAGATDGPATTTPAPRVTAAYGKGVTIASQSGDTELNIRARVQVQGAVETNAPDKSGERPAPDTIFLVRRMRVVFQGNVLHKAMRYYFQLGLATRDMEPDLLVPVRDAYVEWLGLRDLSIRAGQMKVPFSRERVISSSALELVDRSNVNAELSLDRDVGVTLFSRDLFGAGKTLRYSLGIFGGDGRNRTADRAGLLWVARVEALPLGDFDDYVGADLEHAAKPKLSFGVATAYNQSTVRARSTLGDTFTTGSTDYRHATADAHFKWKGFSLHTEVVYRKADTLVIGSKPGSGGATVVERSRPAVGAMVQVGVPLAKAWDLALRYGEVRPLDGDVVHRDREIGGGIGWFPQGHNLKIQLDYFRLVRDTSTATDVSTDRVRLQTQLYF